MNAELLRQFRRRMVQNNFRLAVFRARHFDIQPAHLGTPTSSERFHHRLLGSESARIALVLAALLFLAILNFLFRKHPLTKALASSTVLQGLPDSPDFHHIYTGADNHDSNLAAPITACQRNPRHMTGCTGSVANSEISPLRGTGPFSRKPFPEISKYAFSSEGLYTLTERSRSRKFLSKGELPWCCEESFRFYC